ncbi:hypothetical protein QRX60_29530 [Amycolatopsis mongoliensis]|uniref:Uncharacterized protein n=1 Tax=Amycolatopsis mongoliensis TaxID=715475 RepID=A0A9Y2JHK3_9PSEU|nr:hypothetical protein [Amycolatopsis sp. 4-36]WIX98207.1 hypothetical protein QRX60_29530 [Amycolatopsis sp. 4-36]
MNSSVHQQAGGLVAERRGPHLLIRRHDEAESPGSAIGWPAPAPGHAFVLVSAGAAGESSLVTLLPSLLHRTLVADGDISSVRIGLPGLGADSLVSQALADALGVEIFAPDGDFAGHPGAALYAAHGWLHFRPGSASAPAGRRHPVPHWEASMPAGPVAVGGAAIEPVPAGVLVRGVDDRPAAPGDAAFAVPVDPGVARIVVGADGRVPEPAVVAAAVARLPRVPTQLVVLPSRARTHSWLYEFARVLARDVVVAAVPAAGSGKACFPPFASLIRQRVDGSQEVLEAVSPPRGWERRDRTGYRFRNVVADVVPSGLALRTGAADPAVARAPFDPGGWTVHLGTAGEPVGPELLTAAEALLGELHPVVRDAACLRLAGVLDDRARELLGEPPAPPVAGVPAPVRRPESPTTPGHERPRSPAAGEERPPAAEIARGPVMPPSLLVSGPPVPTVSGAPGVPGPAPALPQADAIPSVPQDEPAERGAGTPASAAGVAGERPPKPARPAEPTPETAADPVGTELARTPGAEPIPEVPALAEPPEADASPVAERTISTGRELVVTDRPSTAAEQARFTTAAGEAYSEALATVNAALATWPSMRQAEAGAKADFVAVCLYLGRGAGNSAELDAAVRSGTGGELDGQVPCLVSGLRRLPIHRRAVLRQSRTGQPPESAVQPGAVLTEPGFLVGSTDLDVTVPDADLDVLIWPASARRTSELRIGQAVSEVVFFAGARFKALAVRTTDPAEDPADGSTATPRTAALFRELDPGEQVSATGELDEHDLAALAKLDQALDRRRRCTLRVVDEPEVLARMTTSLLEWREETASRASANHTITLAS